MTVKANVLKRTIPNMPKPKHGELSGGFVC